jgi:adenylyl-sulfate kinase
MLMKKENTFTIWATGLSGSGKTTIANALQKRLEFSKKKVYIIDGDVLRTGLCADLSYSCDQRSENVRRAAEVAKILNSVGIIVIVALISPLIVDREKACRIIGESNFFEIYISTSLNVCESRDIKGLYARARKGEILDFTGISSPYEPPLCPALQIDTSMYSIDESVTQILAFIEKN